MPRDVGSVKGMADRIVERAGGDLKAALEYARSVQGEPRFWNKVADELADRLGEPRIFGKRKRGLTSEVEEETEGDEDD